MPGLFYNSSSRSPFKKKHYSVSRLLLLFLPSSYERLFIIMGLEKDSNFLHLPFNGNGQGDIYHPIFPAMPSQEQESNFGALYLDNGPWITQNMDIAQPPLKGAYSSSSATQFSKLESAPSSHSQTVTTSSRVKVSLPPVRQRTAQACGKCRERKTKVCASYSSIYVRGYRQHLYSAQDIALSVFAVRTAASYANILLERRDYPHDRDSILVISEIRRRNPLSSIISLLLPPVLVWILWWTCVSQRLTWLSQVLAGMDTRKDMEIQLQH